MFIVYCFVILFKFKNLSEFYLYKSRYYDLRYLKREPWATPYISYAPHKEVRPERRKSGNWKGGQVDSSAPVGWGRGSKGGLR
jgi:hypothetical protein